MKAGKESRLHLGIFGRRNVGKSSFINTLTGQDIAIVSDIAGTTTDPVKKSLEIKGIGPAVIIDTAGIDDIGELGALRIEKSMKTVADVDIAIIMIQGNLFGEFEIDLIERLRDFKTPFFIISNKSDNERLEPTVAKDLQKYTNLGIIEFSCKKPDNLEIIIETIVRIRLNNLHNRNSMLGDILSYGDIVMLITPIDNEAPEGRLILPQVQAIRDILDNDCVAVVLKEKEADGFLRKTGIKPKLVVTDSQIFNKADAIIPKDIPLTGFSVMLARFKGDFDAYLEGTPKISELKDGDRVLLLESCTHQVSCDDIGRVKLPRWINSFTGKKIEYDVVAGLDKLPRPMDDYSLVIQCGGCMITRKQIFNRLQNAKKKNIPITNYGMAIAYLQGIYNRAIEPFVRNNNNMIEYL